MTLRYTLPALVIVLLGIAFFVYPREADSQSGSATIRGFAWSDTIGWVSLNCVDADSCASSNYQILVGYDGTLAGYAWSDAVGWISAQASDLAGCPQAPCTARYQGGAFSGWLKALAGGATGSGGWDGWISLRGSGYGPTGPNGTSGSFSGYAWGSDVVGWLDFSPAEIIYTCAPFYSCTDNAIQYTNSSCAVSTIATCAAPSSCVPGQSSCVYPDMEYGTIGEFDGTLTARPEVVPQGGTARLYWNVENAQSCSITGENGDSWSVISSGAGGQASSPILERTVYTLSCQGYEGTEPPTVTGEATVNVIPIFQEL